MTGSCPLRNTHGAGGAGAGINWMGLTRPIDLYGFTHAGVKMSHMSTAGRISVLTADDHPLMRAGLYAVISSQSDMEVIAEAANGEEAIQRFRERRPDVALVDLRMPVTDGLAATRAIVEEFHGAKIVVLTTYDGDEDIHSALVAGARGYLLKDMMASDLIRVIRAVHAGERVIPPSVAARLAEYTPRVELTPRELEVLKLMAKGLSNRDIAAVLDRTEFTMKNHASNIFEKLGVADRTEAVMIALQRGILHLD
jgi:two-component system NarL family response regulator